nr:unnamed protein product [Spirometra erinaceieuropaei]
MPRQMQLRWSGHLVRMDDERLPKRLFYGDVATGSRRQGGQIRRYKDTLKSSLKRLQINLTKWEELALDRPTWRRTVKTGAAIYEANRIAAVKVKRETRKSQLRPIRNGDAQPLPTYLLNIFGSTAPRPLLSSSSSSYSSYSSYSSSFFSSSSSTAQKTAALVAVTNNNIAHNNDTTTDSIPPTSDSRSEGQDYTCFHCERTFTSRIEAGEPVPGAPTYIHRTCLHCPHCPRTFTHRMGLFGHMRIHESGIDRSSDTPTTSTTPIMPSLTLASSPCAPIATTNTTTITTASSVADTDTADLSCPYCPRTFTSRIGLVCHL